MSQDIKPFVTLFKVFAINNKLINTLVTLPVKPKKIQYLG